jgi:tRNA A37 threonylcarbamoyladenosine biosynthesis protein TsaE
MMGKTHGESVEVTILTGRLGAGKTQIDEEFSWSEV